MMKSAFYSITTLKWIFISMKLKFAAGKHVVLLGRTILLAIPPAIFISSLCCMRRSGKYQYYCRWFYSNGARTHYHHIRCEHTDHYTTDVVRIIRSNICGTLIKVFTISKFQA